jgi:hypothetical protein
VTYNHLQRREPTNEMLEFGLHCGDKGSLLKYSICAQASDMIGKGNSELMRRPKYPRRMRKVEPIYQSSRGPRVEVDRNVQVNGHLPERIVFRRVVKMKCVCDS